MKNNLTFLLATDHSDAVRHAEQYAIRMAGQTKALLSLLHVYTIPFSAVPPQGDEFAKMRQGIHDSELKRLEHHRCELLHALGIAEKDIACALAVREGTVSREVNKEARAIDADLVIAGTHGATGLRENIFGTHTWEIIKNSSIPVLAIPAGAAFTGIKKIVFAAEWRDDEIKGLSFLVQFARRFNAEVILLHITGYSLSKQFEHEMSGKFNTEVKSKIAYDQLTIQQVHSDDIVAGLNDFCDREKPDLLVMSPQRPGLPEKLLMPGTSLTRKMSFHTHIPLLTIPGQYSSSQSTHGKMFDTYDPVDEDR